MTFEMPAHVRPVRDAVEAFMRERVEPAEPVAPRGWDPRRWTLIRSLQAEAKAEGLWALGHPKELGGGGLPFMDYVYVNEVQGRSEFGQIALGTYTLQDSIMLDTYASPEWRGAVPRPPGAGRGVAELRHDRAGGRDRRIRPSCAPRRCSTATSG